MWADSDHIDCATGGFNSASHVTVNSVQVLLAEQTSADTRLVSSNGYPYSSGA
jgi:hypothetical protein